MFEDSMDPVDPGDGPGERVEVTESSADQPISGASGPVGEPTAEQEVSSGPRGPRLVRWAILLVVVSLAAVEISSPLCSGYSLGAIESAFSNQPKAGLTLDDARGHAVGLVMQSFRDEPSQTSSKTGVRFAVFRWPSLFRDHSFEVEVVPSKDGKQTLVRSQPYIRVVTEYKVVQPFYRVSKRKRTVSVGVSFQGRFPCLRRKSDVFRFSSCFRFLPPRRCRH